MRKWLCEFTPVHIGPESGVKTLRRGGSVASRDARAATFDHLGCAKTVTVQRACDVYGDKRADKKRVPGWRGKKEETLESVESKQLFGFKIYELLYFFSFSFLFLSAQVKSGALFCLYDRSLVAYGFYL